VNIPRLGVNIDHVATIRNARGGAHPNPARAALIAAMGGADGITLHIREDRRHVREEDLIAIAKAVTLPINLEMACAEEMLAIALKHRPHACCLVPERRAERTTEGGLDVVGQEAHVASFVRRLGAAGIRVSLFVNPHPAQIEAAARVGAPVVELHTGAYCEAAASGDSTWLEREFEALQRAAEMAAARGIGVHAGHGLDYLTVARVAALPQVAELNIGHFLVGEAVFIGLEAAVAEMKARIAMARGMAA
jgi:pyridoxine 5-phosphate synthase